MPDPDLPPRLSDPGPTTYLEHASVSISPTTAELLRSLQQELQTVQQRIDTIMSVALAEHGETGHIQGARLSEDPQAPKLTFTRVLDSQGDS